MCANARRAIDALSEFERQVGQALVAQGFQVDARRRQAVELETFFATAMAEPFFVKNLENIQGVDQIRWHARVALRIDA